MWYPSPHPCLALQNWPLYTCILYLAYVGYQLVLRFCSPTVRPLTLLVNMTSLDSFRGTNGNVLFGTAGRTEKAKEAGGKAAPALQSMLTSAPWYTIALCPILVSTRFSFETKEVRVYKSFLELLHLWHQDKKGVILSLIVAKYVTIREFSFTKSVMETYKQVSKKNTSKSKPLRKSI